MLIFAVAIAYLLGSISSSYLAGRMIAGIDIREHGSGNAGATNTLRVLGPKVAAVVLLADLLKGVVAVLIAERLTGGQETAGVFAGIAAIAGHNWPIYYGFRGGKGIATTIGVTFTLVPLAALSAGLVAILLLLLLRIVSLASLTFTTLMPIFVFIYHLPMNDFWFTLILAVMALWRHRSNIDRLLKGEEKRLGKKRELK
ncbi:glycerol-3-phosphate acyltransferase 2 [Collibacillus ludicampi]|uniref:Glycerol-3-phosphate acyltransferase n=1 Tax=Collibacillus ludicampi TaxID=2771369 RepID=A0AAV4LM30_9BACL|nr:glycerol-3-phosphate 1-O-acyltransferase PlsY [Collibacillus ludicampi]GIM48207.1 glycerol-3-phosphate acyltransferase 2 [Collibacillus ludicampi]